MERRLAAEYWCAVERPIVVNRRFVTGAQIRAARAFLHLSQRELSKLSKVSHLTIVRMEAANGPVRRRADLVAAVLKILSRKGIQFFASQRFGQGVYLKPGRR